LWSTGRGRTAAYLENQDLLREPKRESEKQQKVSSDGVGHVTTSAARPVGPAQGERLNLKKKNWTMASVVVVQIGRVLITSNLKIVKEVWQSAPAKNHGPREKGLEALEQKHRISAA
jgi:hypothetical protein